jgi:hypothetical protein
MSMRSWRPSPTVVRPAAPPRIVLPVPSPLQLCLVYPGKPYMPHRWGLQIADLASEKEAKKMQEAVDVLTRVDSVADTASSLFTEAYVCMLVCVVVRILDIRTRCARALPAFRSSVS